MVETVREHSRLFTKYDERYARGGCTKAQLRRLVQLSAIYDWEYEEITGEAYE